MNIFTPEYFKRLLIGFSLSLLIIAIFIIAKLIFLKQKPIDVKVFHSNQQERPISKQNTVQDKLMLLPAKN